MIVFPNAKINIGLEIERKRTDGYHDISTVMVPVDWCDILEIVLSDGSDDSLTTSGNKVICAPEENLVMKALRAVRQVTGTILPPVDIYLHKNIPDGAGLGGGSADAAFMIKALNELFNLKMTKDRMAELAAEIGSDCPFFIYNEPMLATGRGEILSSQRGMKEVLSNYCYLIVKPRDISVPTAIAYSRVVPSVPETSLAEKLDKPVEKWNEIVVNRFEESVFGYFPRIAEIKQTLYDLGAVYSAMSGSGSAVFGIFDKNIDIDQKALSIFDDSFVHKCKMV